MSDVFDDDADLENDEKKPDMVQSSLCSKRMWKRG